MNPEPECFSFGSVEIVFSAIACISLYLYKQFQIVRLDNKATITINPISQLLKFKLPIDRDNRFHFMLVCVKAN